MPGLLTPTSNAEPIATVPDPADVPDTTKPAEPVKELNDKIEKRFVIKVEASKKHRRRYTPGWRANIATRLGARGGLTGSEYYEPSLGLISDERQSTINPDWSLSKTKIANLYSQVPAVQGSHLNEAYKPAVAPFMKELNYQISEKGANFGPPMEEVLSDITNAAGIGGIFVGYMARTVPKQVAVEEIWQSPTDGPIPTKSLTPEQLTQLAAVGQLHLDTIDEVVDSKFFTKRISPGRLLWPKEFTESDFDAADWRGYTGDGPWSVLRTEFKLKDDQKDEACGKRRYNSEDDLRVGPEKTEEADEEQIFYDDIYYWRHRFDPDETSFSAIWRIVFVHGIKEAVLHEPWKGQQYVQETRKYVGSCKPPIRFCAITYVSDHPIPPSDSAAARPQVNDLRRSRTQMLDSRDRNRPVNWHDVNRVGQTIAKSLMDGTWMGSIPTNGDGNRAVGQVARASFPAENFRFDEMTKQDLMESWQIGPNQNAQATGVTATESQNVQANFATRIGQEKNKVLTFFLSCVEVLAGWMALYSDFPTLSDQEKQAMFAAWDSKHILHDLAFKIRPDSQLVLDTSQQISRLVSLLNIAGKSGAIEINPLIEEIAEYSGVDPARIMKQPEPPKPEPASMSLRMTGKDDLINPLVMALLVKQQQAPSPQDLETAKKILQAAAVVSPPPQPPGVPGAEGTGVAPGPDTPAPPAGPSAPPEDYTLMDKISKRSEDISG